MDKQYITKEELEKLKKHYFRLETVKSMVYEKERKTRKTLLLILLTSSWIFFFYACLPHIQLFPFVELVLGVSASFVSWILLQKLNYL